MSRPINATAGTTMPISQIPAAELARVRSHFPALARQVGGEPVAYFDGPGGTQVPREVADAVADYLLQHNANTHWAYPTSQETDALLLAARQAVADLVGGVAEEIAFGANMTTLTFHLSRALGRAWGPGDEVIVTELDHHANVAPWHALARERGVTIRTVPVLPDRVELDLRALEALLGPRTRLVAVGAASNAVGTINEVPVITARARTAGALTFVDAVHYAPHRLVDVEALGADFLACSAYKFYGTHVGILWGRKPLIEALDVPKLLPAPNSAPERLETGTQNHEGIAGVLAAIDWLASLGGRGGATGARVATGVDQTPETQARRLHLKATYEAFEAREAKLFRRLWDVLGSTPGITRFGRPPGANRTGTVSVSTGSRSPGDVARALADQGLFVSHGDFYATTAVERLGFATQGLLRVGLSCYSTDEEIERLGEGLRRVLRSEG